jgi:hypothetical protein
VTDIRAKISLSLSGNVTGSECTEWSTTSQIQFCIQKTIYFEQLSTFNLHVRLYRQLYTVPYHASQGRTVHPWNKHTANPVISWLEVYQMPVPNLSHEGLLLMYVQIPFCPTDVTEIQRNFNCSLQLKNVAIIIVIAAVVINYVCLPKYAQWVFNVIYRMFFYYLICKICTTFVSEHYYMKCS